MLKLDFIKTDIPPDFIKAGEAAGGRDIRRYVAQLPDESEPGGRSLPHGWVRVTMLRRPAGTAMVWEMSISHCKALGDNPPDRAPDDDEVAPCLALVKNARWLEISAAGSMIRRYMSR